MPDAGTGPAVVEHAKQIAARSRTGAMRLWAAARDRLTRLAARLRHGVRAAAACGRVGLAIMLVAAALLSRGLVRTGAGWRVQRGGRALARRLEALALAATRLAMVCLAACRASVERAIRAAHWAMGTDADAGEALASANQLDEDFEIVSVGGTGWGRRLSRGARIGRAAAIVGTVGIAVILAVGGPGAALSFAGSGWDQLANRINPKLPINALPIHLNASSWVAERLPGDAFRVRGIELRPSPADPRVAYACWPDHPNGGTGPAPVSLYVTHNGARSWVALDAPIASATLCRLVPDAADAWRVVLLTYASDLGTCAPPNVFASDDFGVSWARVGLPATLRPACDLAFFSLRGRLFAWSGSAQNTLAEGPTAQLLTSVDAGANWSQAFPNLPAGVVVTLVAAHGDGSVLALLSPAADRASPAGPATRTLWCAEPGMGQWIPIGQIPPGTTRVVASDDPDRPAGCQWSTLYALGFSGGDEGALGVVGQVAVATKGNGWRSIPPLADVGGASGIPLGDDGRVLAVGSGGTLLIDVPYFGSGSLGIGSPEHVIWGWDPVSGRWLRDYHVEPGNATIEGYAWDHSQGSGSPRLVVWLYSLNWGLPAFTGIFQSTFAPAPVAPAGLPGALAPTGGSA